MRKIVFPVVAALFLVIPLLTPASLTLAAPAPAAGEYLPDEATIRRVLSPMNISGFAVNPPKDGWDLNVSAIATGGPGGGPDVPVLISIYASELPTDLGAAGFAQAQMAVYREIMKSVSLEGDLGPSPDSLTMDADEAYLGVFLTPDGAPSRILNAVIVSRYETVVTAIEVTMLWDTPGTISTETQRGLGMVLGLLLGAVNELAG